MQFSYVILCGVYTYFCMGLQYSYPPNTPSFMVPFSSEKTIIFLSIQALGGYLLSNKGINTPLNWTSIALKGEGSKLLESGIG